MKIHLITLCLLFIYKSSFCQVLQPLEESGTISTNGYFSAGKSSFDLTFSTWTAGVFSKRLTILQNNGDIISTGNYFSQGLIKTSQGFISENGVFRSANSLFKLQSSQGFLFEPGGASKFIILPSGNVGVGLANGDIKQPLHVAGNIQSNNEVIANSIELIAGVLKSTSQNLHFETPESFEFRTSGTNKNFTFDGGNLLVKKSIFIDENLGIKTNTVNGFDLAVRGKIVALDLQIKKDTSIGNSWPDYVFDSTYVLPPLSSVQDFIIKHKHLDGVPSTKQVAEDGYSTNEMTMALLKKVEELTLYIIQQQKEIDELKKAVQDK